jgi:gluconate 2-dehydrogenase gamma chain
MDRRKSIKTLLVGTAVASVLIESCETTDKNGAATSASGVNEDDRMVEEKIANKKLSEEVFFTSAEMVTITLLGDIIIPKDKVSGSASEAKVPDFIEFIVKDMPEHQTPMRGGLRWLDLNSLKRFGNSFANITDKQRLELVDEIAYPNKAKATMKQGVAFFNLMRNLTTTGFYTSEMGVKDVGYMGNVPNQWNGVPDDVLKEHNLSYSERELKECISFDNKA